jgi:hypothetical protein
MIPGRRAINRHALAVCFGLLVSGTSSLAHADDAAIAEQLFLDGKKLMQDGHYEQACSKLQASHDLDRSATGTLFNLALCHELTNRPASAWAEFRQVIAESAGRRDDRAALAREHEEKLLPKVSHLVIKVPPEARTEGLHILMDKRIAIAEASWGAALPVDPGKHVLEVAAPGRLTRTLEVGIGDVADTASVDVAPLALAPYDKPGPSGGGVDLATSDAVAAARVKRSIGLTVGGLGIAAVGVGAVFGIMAAGKSSDAKRICPDKHCATNSAEREASDAVGEATTNANVANVTIGVGAAMIVGGLVLVLTAKPPKPAEPTARAALRIDPRPNGAGLSLGGTW